MGDGYDDAAKQLGAVAEAMHGIDDGQMLALGHAALNIITLRTGAGLDADRKPFVPYSDAYKKVRAAKSLQTGHVDLAVTGHMIGAASVSPGVGEVTLGFNSAHEANKAAAHNSGVKAQVSVRAHSRDAHVNKKGQRVSARERRLDKRRKNKRVYQRTESVSAHKRNMNLPERNWFDVRADEDVAALTEMVGIDVARNVEKVIK